jgi:two-component system response regulator HydG
MALPLQAKLLHVLESGTVRALGSNVERTLRARIIAATHRDLRERARTGAFREDLIYRLDVVTIPLPPLRLRRDDLPELIAHLLDRSKKRHPRSVVERFAPDALSRLLEHHWPGNVRELEHVIERAVLLGRAPSVSVSDLPSSVTETAPSQGLYFSGEIVPMREMQRRYAAWAFERLGERKVQTAEKLGIDFKTLHKWLTPESEGETERRE